MPFQSERQRRFMYANHPEIARRWTAVYGSKPRKKRKAKRRGRKTDHR